MIKFSSTKRTVHLWGLAIIGLVCLTAACNQSDIKEVVEISPSAVSMNELQQGVSTDTPLSPPATATELAPSKTAVPPIEPPASPTPVPPTNTPTPEPTVVFGEEIAVNPTDIVGIWDSERGSQIIFTQSGGARIIDRHGMEMVGIGTFHFENEQMVLDSNACLSFEAGFGNVTPCQAFYNVYLLISEDTIVGLRFDLIEDAYRDRKNAMTGVDWFRSEE